MYFNDDFDFKRKNYSLKLKLFVQPKSIVYILYFYFISNNQFENSVN